MDEINELQKQVNALIEKAVLAETSEMALKFSQAALNVAHTKHALIEISGK